METRTSEVADGIYQFTTYIADFDFCFNQYLVTGDEPLLFHTGARQLFPLVTDAIAHGDRRPTRCAGSRSVTSSPTSAAR